MCKLAISLFFSFISLSVFSQQTGSLQGRVIGKDSLPISNASIRLLNTEKGGISNLNGQFKISALLPGKYQMELSAVGYTQKVSSVEIVAGEQKETDYYLDPAVSYLDEVVVSAEKYE